MDKGQMIKSQFADNYTIVRLPSVPILGTDEDIWLNCVTECNWCVLCSGIVHFKMFFHKEVCNDDWEICEKFTVNQYSAFFAFERYDDALMFSIKFKK